MNDFTPPLNRIDVWILRTDDPDVPLSRFEDLLAKEELHRANRFRFDHLRRGYILSRSSLRILCARYLKMDAASLRLRYGTNGKPELDFDSSLKFNLSHSGGVTVFAFAWDLEIGVDVEKIREMRDIDDIVRRFFCPEEAKEVLATPKAERTLAFYTCWTRKEAFIKATGDGLSTPLDSFQVSIKSGQPARLAHINFDANEGTRWTLHDLNLEMPYVGALCYRATARALRLSQVINAHAIVTGLGS